MAKRKEKLSEGILSGQMKFMQDFCHRKINACQPLSVILVVVAVVLGYHRML
jgi:hypothetical protein